MFHINYLHIINKCSKIKEKLPNFQYLNISTITITGELNTNCIDIQYLSENFESPPFPACIIKKTKQHGDYVETKRGKKQKSFYNQISVQYKDTTQKSIKIFSNGKLQMTGITSLNEAENVSNFICNLLQNTFPNHKQYKTTTLNIGMINTNFTFGHSLDILKLKDLYNNDDYCSVEYSPDVYPGLKIKYKTGNQKNNIFVFATGNVLITGVKSMKEVLDAFNFITLTTLNNWKSVNLGKASIKEKTNNHQISNGYISQNYLCATPNIMFDK